jgi:D-alanyl-D-alanine carboxypeptidase
LLDFTDYDTSRTWGSGNIVSSVRDLATFFSALLRGSVISPVLLSEMKQTVATGRFPDERAGLGLFRWGSRWGRPVWGKDGDTPGFSTLVLVSEDGTRQVCIMVNAMFAPAGVKAALEQAISQAVREAFVHLPPRN